MSVWCVVCMCSEKGGGVDNIIWSLHGGFVLWDVGFLWIILKLSYGLTSLHWTQWCSPPQTPSSRTGSSLYRDYRGLEGARGTPYSVGTTLLVSVSSTVLVFRIRYRFRIDTIISSTTNLSTRDYLECKI